MPDDVVRSPEFSSHAVQVNTSTADFSIVKDESFEDTRRAVVRWHVVIHDQPSENSVRALLSHLYEIATNRTGSQLNALPTGVSIYVYESQAHAKAEMGQWLGMLSKGKNDAAPEITIQRHAMAGARRSNSEIRFGLTEPKRREIWEEIVAAEDRAAREAEARFPMETTTSQVQVKKRLNFIKSLIKGHRHTVVSKNRLTEAQLDAISKEALEENWPFPQMNSALR